MKIIDVRKAVLMGKGKQRPPQYNRQSKGYQQNVYKQQMKEKNVEMPKPIDMDKFTKRNRIVVFVWVVALCLGWWRVGWILGVIILVAGAAYLGYNVWYLRNYSVKYIKAYKQMGMPKDMYIKQLRKSGTDVKQIERLSKSWDKVKVD